MNVAWLQRGYAVRLEWGAAATELVQLGDVVIVVDVLSFSTTVSIALDRGMRIRPLADAVFADPALPVGVRREEVDAAHPFSLSPAHARLAPFVELVQLPSPNGATVSAAAAAIGANVFAGCLRNARATSIAALRALRGTDPAAQRRRPVNSIIVVPAGERWPDGTLRPAFEDLIGAGSIVAALIEGGVDPESCSPEAHAARAAWQAVGDVGAALRDCASGRELIDRGYPEDVAIAAELDASPLAALLNAGSFVAIELQPRCGFPYPGAPRGYTSTGWYSAVTGGTYQQTRFGAIGVPSVFTCTTFSEAVPASFVIDHVIR